MKKATGTRTATTYTVDPSILLAPGLDEETRDELSRPYTWDDEYKARESVAALAGQNGYKVVTHLAPGLTVHAIYRYANRNSTVLVLMSIIEFADDLAADLHTAVRKQQPVTVSYTKADGTDTVRTVEPRDVVATTAGSLIVRGIDRESEGTRSFRLDRISAYTVHRSRFTVRTGAPAPRKSDLVATFRLGTPRPAFTAPAARVRSATEGFKGRTLPETRAFGPTGWTVKVALEGEWAGMAASGTVRVRETDLVRL